MTGRRLSLSSIFSETYFSPLLLRVSVPCLWLIPAGALCEVRVREAEKKEKETGAPLRNRMTEWQVNQLV